jgi:hypothetical protein
LRHDVIDTRERHGLTRVYHGILARAGGIRRAFGDLDDRAIARVVDLEPVAALAQQDHRDVRRVDLDVFVVIEVAHGDAEHARGHAHLDGVIVDVEKGEAGVGVQAYVRRTDFDFGARAAVGPQLVAGGHRTVEDGGCPLLFTGRLQGDIALDITEPRRAFRRVLIGQVIVLCEGQAPGEPECHCRKRG